MSHGAGEGVRWMENCFVTTDQLVCVSDEHGNSILRNHYFKNCTIVGPQMFISLSNTTFDGCMFNAPLEALITIIPPHKPVIGAIGLDGVTFEGCRFEHIGIFMTQSHYDAFVAAIVPSGACPFCAHGGADLIHPFHPPHDDDITWTPKLQGQIEEILQQVREDYDAQSE